MRQLLVRFMERRAFGRKVWVKRAPMPGTDVERLQRAQNKLLLDVPRLDALATKLCGEYVEGKRTGAAQERLLRLEVEIEGIDTQCRLAKSMPEIIVGVIYRSYCLGEPSVTVAHALGLKPPAVRQLLSRLAQTWRLIQT
jgi:hypothetical protein